MKHLTTKRIRIREANEDDAEFFYTLMNSRGWLTFIGDRKIRTTDDAKTYIQTSLIHHYANFGYGLFVVYNHTTNQPIGINGFLKRGYLDYPDIGFAFLPDFNNQGYALESSKLLLEYGVSQLGFTRVHAITVDTNQRSTHLLVKLDFSFQETIKPNDQHLLLYTFTG
ncbi:MAG: ribosomal-protein-alanine N-acetyltransferase [Bacteroidia bacterium]|jgi:ribosomal-protein-alanine N-acetyltransferase